MTTKSPERALSARRLPERSAPKRIVILGSTGSIGVNTLNVVRSLGDQCRVVALSAYGNLERLLGQIREFKPEVVSVWSEEDAAKVRSLGIRHQGHALKVLSGIGGLVELAQWPTSNFVLSAVVGAIGLRPLLAALESGKIVALANKEALVMAGELVMSTVRQMKATLLPVDSEHSAIFQCLAGSPKESIKRLILTASGGPFYRKRGSLSGVTVDQALAHPTWKMGRKITIDSATLMNKGLETIEASILFGLPIDKVDIVIHPQSIVHSLVEFVDHAMIAQLSLPDMCLPIQYAISYPSRVQGPLAPLDLAKAKTLEFIEPDFSRFPCLTLSREAARKGGSFPTVMNAADEVAVYAFLEGKIKFTSIARVVEKTLAKHRSTRSISLQAVLEADAWARQTAKEFIR